MYHVRSWMKIFHKRNFFVVNPRKQWVSSWGANTLNIMGTRVLEKWRRVFIIRLYIVQPLSFSKILGDTSLLRSLIFFCFYKLCSCSRPKIGATWLIFQYCTNVSLKSSSTESEPVLSFQRTLTSTWFLPMRRFPHQFLPSALVNMIFRNLKA